LSHTVSAWCLRGLGIFGCVMGSILGCSPKEAVTAAPAIGPRDIDVLEAVFRHQFEHSALGDVSREKLDVIFLALGTPNEPVDPPAELLSRFSTHVPPVEPASNADRSGRGVKPKDRQATGVIYHVTRLRPIDADTVDVDGGYFSGGLDASGNAYRVKLEQGAWSVVAEAMYWIS